MIRVIAASLVALALTGCATQPSPTTSPSPTTTARPIATARPTNLPSPTAPPTIATPTQVADEPIDSGELSGLIAFARDNGIWIANADGSMPRQLTTDGGFDPSVSFDDNQIAYRRMMLPEDDGAIWTVDVDGSDARDLVQEPDSSDWAPAFSPDGSLIAYSSNREFGLTIWTMNSDGSDRRVIGSGHGEYPAWSPDGSQIVYAGGSYYDIWVMNADGSEAHAVTETAAYDMGPAWSPDGQWIAYHTQVDHYPDIVEPGMGPEMEIHLVRPDGSDDHRITDNKQEDAFPVWSPDGRFLMWTRDGELVIARPDGSGLITIGAGNFPSWSP